MEFSRTATGSAVMSDSLSRREFLAHSAVVAAGGAMSLAGAGQFAVAEEKSKAARQVQTVLGPVDPAKLGTVLMHEHAPVVDWSELYETAPAPIDPARKKLLDESTRLLDAFHQCLPEGEGPGAIVETTPIRVGRYPRLLTDLARQTKVHVIAATGFWCEALAPQHPWALRLSVAKNGPEQMAELFVREITEGMEDPAGEWGQRFTDVRAGVIKIGTSTWMRPGERAIHIAAARASQETGCPITTHTTSGGGLEEAELLLKQGASPARVIIGHQGHQDDRQNDEATEYHQLIAKLGCYVQFDRVDHGDYGIEKQARQIVKLLEAGFGKQVLVSHDHAPFYYPEFAATEKAAGGWKATSPDYTTVVVKLVPALRKLGASKADVRRILIENPARVLAFA